jgi:Tfp pilus assembly protein PilW
MRERPWRNENVVELLIALVLATVLIIVIGERIG